MGKVALLLKAILHPADVLRAVSTAVRLADGEKGAAALGGLTDEETAALIGFLPDEGTFVEFGTLFGLTAKAVATAKPRLKVVAVDDFSWNPLGLPAAMHERFTRQILSAEIAAGRVEVVRTTSAAFRASCTEPPAAVFFDAQHEYGPVRDEIAWARRIGVRCICGHDYANPSPRFGVTRAVDEAFGGNVDVAGMVWRAR